MEISDIIGWGAVLELAKEGELRRDDTGWIVDLLRSGEPVPPEALPLVADVLEGTHPFKKGSPAKTPTEKRTASMLYNSALLWCQITKHHMETGVCLFDQEAIDALGEQVRAERGDGWCVNQGRIDLSRMIVEAAFRQETIDNAKEEMRWLSPKRKLRPVALRMVEERCGVGDRQIDRYRKK